MLCRRCHGTEAGVSRRTYLYAPTVGAVCGVLCARCGAILGPDDLTSRLVAKLAQLNGFGLAGRDGVLRIPRPSPKDS